MNCMRTPPATGAARRRHPLNRRGRQRGVALVVILLLLLVVTLLGLAGIRGALLQERMAANAFARSLAFQMSEAVLREAEGFAAGKPPAPASGCKNGVCVNPGFNTPAWQVDGFWDKNSGWVTSKYEFDDGVRPRYVVEEFGEAPSTSCSENIDMSADPCDPTETVYRVTVRSRSGDGAEVLLQSLFRVP